MADHARAELPAGVERLPGGGYRVGDPPGWDWFNVTLAAGSAVVGLAVLALAIVVQRSDATEPVLYVVAAVFLVAGAVLLRTLGRKRPLQVLRWTIDADGLTTVLGSVAWSRIVVMELRDRHERLPTGVNSWGRLVTVTAYDARGFEVLRLPDETDDQRLRAVFTRAYEDGLVPAHVRYVQRNA